MFRVIFVIRNKMSCNRIIKSIHKFGYKFFLVESLIVSYKIIINSRFVFKKNIAYIIIFSKNTFFKFERYFF